MPNENDDQNQAQDQTQHENQGESDKPRIDLMHETQKGFKPPDLQKIQKKER